MIDEFKKVLGLPACLAVAVGIIVAQATMMSVLEGASIGGGGFLIAMAAACVLMICTNFTFSELSMMLPRAGSLGSYTEIALGHFPAIVAVLAGYVVVSLLAVPAELALFGMVFNEVFSDALNPMEMGLILLFILMVLNLTGTDLFAKVQTILTFFLAATLVGLGVIGLMNLGATPPVELEAEPFNPMGWKVITLVTLATWAFVGAEFVCSLVEETRRPARNIPLSMNLAVLIAFIMYALFMMGTLRHMTQVGLMEAKISHLAAAEAILGRGGMIWMGVACIAATGSTINSLLATAPRMLYGMAHAGQAPAFLAYLHPKFKTPWVAIIALTAGMTIPLFWVVDHGEKIMILLVAATCCWLISYIIAHIDVIVLRIRHPEYNRPFKTPFYPVPQLIGILGMGFVLLNNFPDPRLKNEIYQTAGWLLLGAVLYSALWVKLVMKKKLFQPESLETAMTE